MAGLLDIFSIGFNSEGLREFETNLKNNEKELDKYNKQVKELEKKLNDLESAEKKDTKAIAQVKTALEEARGNVKKFEKSVDTMKGKSEFQLSQLKKNFVSLTKAIGLLASVGAAVKKSIDFYEQGEQLEFLAQKSNIAVDALQRLGNAASHYGGTTEGTAGTVETLNSKEGKANLAAAGISSGASPEQTLENIARKMENLKTTAEKLELAKSLGIDEGTTRLLMEGADRYTEELKKAKKYQLFTPEDIARMREYRQTQQDIRMGLESIFGAIWRMLLPAITAVSKVIRSVTDWLAEHQDVVKVVGIITLVAGGIIALTGLLPLLGGAFITLSKVFLMTPFGWVTAAIAAIILVINDLIVFMQGGDSIIGRLFEKWGIDADKWRKILSTAFENIKKDFLALVEKLKALGLNLKETLENIMPDWMKNFFKRNGALYKVMKKGSEKIIQYNNRHENAVPAGAVSNYNQTQSINNNNNANTRSINNTNTANTKSMTNANTNKNVNIQKVEINAQGADARGVYNQFKNATNGLDNGMRA